MANNIRLVESRSGLGSVNCYLIGAGSGFILVDTGYSTSRGDLEKELVSAGCEPGGLKLIVLTHGDVDHTGNCAYLQKKFGARVAMHGDDFGMTAHGDMSWNRRPNPLLAMLLKRMPLLFRAISLFSPASKYEGFKPDIAVDDGFDLSPYGLDARVVYLPGHSKGSIGILTTGGNLFCGDLLENVKKPALNSIMDDREAAKASVDRLKSLQVKTLYPGHGKPFTMGQFKL